MSDDSSQNEPQSSEDIPPGGPARLGGVLIFLGTALSMLVEDWLAGVAMGAALLGLVLVLAGRHVKKT